MVSATRSPVKTDENAAFSLSVKGIQGIGGGNFGQDGVGRKIFWGAGGQSCAGGEMGDEKENPRRADQNSGAKSAKRGGQPDLTDVMAQRQRDPLLARADDRLDQKRPGKGGAFSPFLTTEEEKPLRL